MTVMVLNTTLLLTTGYFCHDAVCRKEMRTTSSLNAILLSLLLGYLCYHISHDVVLTLIYPHLTKVHPFNGDVMAGSLPLLVDILQSGSLWTAKSDYGHYLNGYELMQSWGVLFLRNESIFGIFHYAFALILLYFSFKIYTWLLRNEPRTITYYASFIALFSFFFIGQLIPKWILAPFGKTDLPSMALTVMAFYFFLRTCLDEDALYGKNLMLTVLASCLFTAIKPQSLYIFLPLFVMLTWQHFKIRQRGIKQFIVLFLPMVFSASLYVRFKMNMSDAYMTAGTQSTLFYYFFMKDHAYLNALYPDQKVLQHILYDRNWENMTFYFSAFLSGVLLIALPFLSKTLRLVCVIFIISFIAFLFAPLAIWTPCIQIRYSLAMLPMLFILVTYSGYSMMKIVNRLPQPTLPPLPRVSPFVFIFAFSFLVLGQSLFWHHRYHDFPGNHEPQLASGIYRYVYDHVQHKKIYFFIAKPFGLYGKGLQNELIYDKQVHGSHSMYDPLRWADGIAEYEPDYFVYQTYLRSNPAHRYPAEIEPLLHSSIASKLRIVYADSEGVVIEVHHSPL